MNLDEQRFLQEIEALSADEPADNISEAELDLYINKLDTLLFTYGISYERYHEILLENMENIVEKDN